MEGVFWGHRWNRVLVPLLGLFLIPQMGCLAGWTVSWMRASSLMERPRVSAKTGGFLVWYGMVWYGVFWYEVLLVRVLVLLEPGLCFAVGSVSLLADGLPGWLDRGLENRSFDLG